MKLSLEQIQIIGKIASAFAYVGILATTALSVYSLHKKTVIESDDPLTQPNKFTPAGKKYLKLLVGCTLLTITVSIVQNWCNSQIQDAAQTKLLGTILSGLAMGPAHSEL